MKNKSLKYVLFILISLALTISVQKGFAEISTKEDLVFDRDGKPVLKMKSADGKLVLPELKEGEMLDIGREVISYKDSVVVNEANNAKILIKSFGNTFLYKSKYGNETVLRVHGDQTGLGVPLFVMIDYSCELSERYTTKTDYKKYMVVVKLLAKKSEEKDASGVIVPIFDCEISGNDDVAGMRKFAMAAMMDPSKPPQLWPFPLGKLPGTRVVLGDGVKLTLTRRTGTEIVNETFMSGDAFEITLDNKLRILKRK